MSFRTEEELDIALSQPYPETVAMMKRLKGDILILGVGGKMGPSLAMMAKRAVEEAGTHQCIIGVARFSETGIREKLNHAGIETIRCDLMDPQQVQALPDAENVIFMAGRKFGSVGSEPLTWMMNVIVPGIVAERYQKSNLLVFSTGCVYSLSTPESGGSKESDFPEPVGEYANSCLGRERIFQYYSEKHGTKVQLYRLNYSIDCRYGVLVDVARKIISNQPIDLGVSYVNIIWQGDACNRALLGLEHTGTPATILNITGPELLHIKDIAEQFGKLLGKEVHFTGKDNGAYYLSNASRSIELYGLPKIKPEQMIQWVADWINQGGNLLDKPTHFEVTNGQFLD